MCYCSVVPDYLLSRIAVNHPDPAQRQLATYAVSVTSRLRGRRDLLGPLNTLVGAIGGEERTVYDAGHMEQAPGQRTVRAEGQQPCGDKSADQAYDYSGVAYDLYKQVFNRNSVDDRGLHLNSTVHYSTNYDNAFWDGRQMIYGDGDQRIFGSFTACIDVIIHELTHGVTQYTAGLAYQGATGALNESVSDIVGTIGKQWHLKQDFAAADWLIGAGLLMPGIKGVALRSMKAPGTAFNDPVLGKDPQPAHMKDYIQTNQDNGGVHTNSGIPNHWFYLLCFALSDRKSWEDPGQIVYGALRKARFDTNFQAFAGLTMQVAQELFGGASRQHDAVKQAWFNVGINV